MTSANWTVLVVVTVIFSSLGCHNDDESIHAKYSNPALVAPVGEPKVVFLRLPITDGSIERLKQEDVEEVLAGKIAFLRHGIGIKYEENRCHIVFESGQMVGCVKTLALSTVTDNQESIDMSLVYGDSDINSKSTRIGDIRIIELPPSKAGALQLEVTIEVKVDGTVEVYGRDKKSDLALGLTKVDK